MAPYCASNPQKGLCTRSRCERPSALAAMPLALVPLREGDIKSIRIRQRTLPLTEGESRRRRQGVGHADFLCKAPLGLRGRPELPERFGEVRHAGARPIWPRPPAWLWAWVPHMTDSRTGNRTNG